MTAKTYNVRAEAQRVITAIEPQRGATITVMCALREAYEAGKNGSAMVWRFEEDAEDQREAVTGRDVL